MIVRATGYSVHERPFNSNRKLPLNAYLIRLQMEGVCQATVNGKEYYIRPGHLLLCKPGDQYQLNVPLEKNDPPRSADYHLTLTSDELWFKTWWKLFDGSVLIHLGVDEALASTWKQIVYEKRRVKDSSPLILEHLTRVLLLHIQRMCQTDMHVNVYERSVSNQIKMYIERNAAEQLTLKEISASVGLSVSRASQLFKATVNQSIMDYAIEVKMTMAKERMLHDGITLQEIAYLCGFSNYTHFNRLFRSRFGMSPSQYNKLMRAR
jgi:AraC family transcriptional regulator of arabinose operon